MEKLLLNTPSLQGTLYIGEGAVKKYLPALTRGQKNFVLTDTNLYALYGQFFEEYFSGAEIFIMQAGEEYKSFQTLETLLSKMIDAGLKRSSRLFAVGGGVVGDLGGLAASLYMRGISCVQVPTTLLAQIDSSVGGKTAINACGVKNAVGAFYQPQTVLVDPAFLHTLPEREWKCGVGELVKYAALNGELFDTLYANKERLNDKAFLLSLIGNCIRHKAKVSEEDEKENGLRKSLNLGHTTGHALELFYRISHGEGVLYGIKAETKTAISKGICDRAYGEKLIRLAESALAFAPTEKLDFSYLDEALSGAVSDKKNAEDGKITLVTAKGKGEWMISEMDEKEYRIAVTEALTQ